MPYPGIKSPSTIKKVDDCVNKIMADPKFKPKAGRSKKSSAIAICISTIKGAKMKKETFSYTPSEESFTKGTLLKNVEIFKEGVFKGKKWVKKQLEEIVDNFKKLKETAKFDPPVRLGHRSDDSISNVKNIVGYIEDVRLGENKNKEAIILSDCDVVDKKSLEDIKNGKYRKKSVEVGFYDDNQGNEYNPAILGLGIVDIPAVEGMPDLAINMYSKPMKTKEDKMEKDKKDKVSEKNKDGKVDKESKKIDKKLELNEKQEKNQSTDKGKDLKKLSKDKQDVVTFDRKTYEAFISEKQEFEEKRIKNRMKQFVKDGKVTPGLLKNETEFVKSLNENQRTSYFSIKENMPEMIKFGKKYGKTNSDGEPEGKTEKQEAMEKAIDNIKMYLKQSGWTDKQIGEHISKLNA